MELRSVTMQSRDQSCSRRKVITIWT